MKRAVISHSVFIFQSPLAKGSPTILEVFKQYQTSSSPKKRVQVQGHGAAQKSESSDSSSGMFVLTECVDDVSSLYQCTQFLLLFVGARNIYCWD